MPSPARSETGDPLLLTPGPLTTSKSVKQAMVHDWGSRDAAFIALNAEVLESLPKIVHGEGAYVTVPMQGSRDGAVLVLINGAYGQRAKRILAVAGRKTFAHETPEDTPPDLDAVERILGETPAITHVFAVHCETTSGILNPIEKIAALCARRGKRLLIDAMSAFGALELDARTTPFDAVAASANKCLEGVPGLGFVVCRREALVQSEGNATTLSLDLLDQRRNLEKTGQYRFTPPIHVIVAFHQALQEFLAEGGVAGRGGRYAENARILIGGMRSLGFKTLLPDALQAPIIATFRTPSHPNFVFQRFYDSLKERGYVIYPGKLTVADSFRIGCIGRLYPDQMRGALEAARETLAEMGVALTPAPAA
jgi:2-aminoethylphosphonate-pyruvate transaminase